MIKAPGAQQTGVSSQPSKPSCSRPQSGENCDLGALSGSLSPFRMPFGARLPPAAVIAAVQRHAGNRAAAVVASGSHARPPQSSASLVNGARETAVRVQTYLEEVARRDVELAGLIAQLENEFSLLRRAAGGVTERQRRLVGRVEATYRSMERASFTPDAILRWTQAVFAASSQFAHGHEWIDESTLERLRTRHREIQRISTQMLRRGPVAAAAEQQTERREQAREQDRRRQLAGQLARYIRGRWQSIRAAPALHAVSIRAQLLRELGSEEAARAFVADPPGASPELGRFLRLLLSNPRSLEEGHDDVLRAAVLAVGGEWADIALPPDIRSRAEQLEAAGVELTQAERDRLEAAELTGGSGETGLEAEVVGTGLDTAITLIPIVDQVGDVRDFAAHVYALLDVDGRHPDEHLSWMRWLGVTLSGVGLVPELGTALRGTGRIAMRVLGAAGDIAAPVVARLVDPVTRLIRRAGGADWVRRLIQGVSTGWSAIAATARRGWDRVARGVADALASPAARVFSALRAARDRWAAARAAGAAKIGEALAFLRRLFQPLFRAVLDGLRRGAARILPHGVQRAGRLALDVAAAAGRRARRRIDDLVDELGGATRRLELADEAFERLDAVESDLRRARTALAEALDGGDADEVESLTRQVNELNSRLENIADDLERRVGGHIRSQQPAAPGRGALAGRGSRRPDMDDARTAAAAPPPVEAEAPDRIASAGETYTRRVPDGRLRPGPTGAVWICSSPCGDLRDRYAFELSTAAGGPSSARLDQINAAIETAREADDADALAAAMDEAEVLANELRALRRERLQLSHAPEGFQFRRASLDPDDPDFWETVADTIGEGTVVEFDDGLRAWRNPRTGNIEHEWTASAGAGRAHLERGHWSAGELRGESDEAERYGEVGRPGNRSPGTRSERAHASGQGTGPESPYAIYDAPRFVNQDLQNQGIERFIRRLRDECGPGESIQVVTSSAPHPRTRRLREIEYHLELRRGDEIVDLGRYRIEISGSEANPLIEAAPFDAGDSGEAADLLSRVPMPAVLTQAVSHQI